MKNNKRTAINNAAKTPERYLVTDEAKNLHGEIVSRREKIDNQERRIEDIRGRIKNGEREHAAALKKAILADKKPPAEPDYSALNKEREAAEFAIEVHEQDASIKAGKLEKIIDSHAERFYREAHEAAGARLAEAEAAMTEAETKVRAYLAATAERTMWAQRQVSHQRDMQHLLNLPPKPSQIGAVSQVRTALRRYEDSLAAKVARGLEVSQSEAAIRERKAVEAAQCKAKDREAAHAQHGPVTLGPGPDKDTVNW